MVGLDRIVAIVFGVVLMVLIIPKSLVMAGRANGVSLHPPGWLVRSILGQRS
jgi:hypothetical protein